MGEPPGAGQAVQEALIRQELGMAAAAWADRAELPPLSQALLLSTVILRLIFCMMWNQKVPAVNQERVCFCARWEEQVLPGTALLGRTAAAAHTQSKSKRSRSKSPHRKCLLPLSGKEISTFLHKGKEKLLCGYQDSAEEPRRLKSLSLSTSSVAAEAV